MFVSTKQCPWFGVGKSSMLIALNPMDSAVLSPQFLLLKPPAMITVLKSGKKQKMKRNKLEKF